MRPGFSGVLHEPSAQTPTVRREDVPPPRQPGARSAAAPSPTRRRPHRPPAPPGRGPRALPPRAPHGPRRQPIASANGEAPKPAQRMEQPRTSPPAWSPRPFSDPLTPTGRRPAASQEGRLRPAGARNGQSGNAVCPAGPPHRTEPLSPRRARTRPPARPRPAPPPPEQPPTPQGNLTHSALPPDDCVTPDSRRGGAAGIRPIASCIRRPRPHPFLRLRLGLSAYLGGNVQA